MQKHGGKAIALDSRRITHMSLEKPAVSSLTNALGQDMDQFALSYSYYHHIVLPNPASNKKLYVQDEKILACMKAMGMASYSMITRSNKLHNIAFGYYITALQAINSALRHPNTAMEDGTLLAIMCLSCLESISETWNRSLKGMSMHIQGMVSLIELRGAAQMKTASGRLLFAQSCSFIVTDCIRAGLPVPTSIHDMVAEFLKAMKPQDFHVLKREMLPAYLRIGHLKSAIIHGYVTDPVAIIEEARDIDRMFAISRFDVPYKFGYTLLAHRTKPGSELPAYSYRYHTTLLSTAWNGSRNGRMLCHSIIVDVLKRTPDTFNTYINVAAQIEASCSIIRQMQMEILAGVPQILGLRGPDPWTTLDEATWQPFLRSQDDIPSPVEDPLISIDTGPTNLPVLRVSRGVFLVFNLALVGRLSGSGSQIRMTVCKILRVMGRDFGMSLAFIIATALEESRISGSVIDYRKKADAWVIGEESEEPLVGVRLPEN